MTDNIITLFCLVDGESTSNAFPVKVSLKDTIGDLKKAIKTEKAHRFDAVDADELTLWQVALPVVPANKHKRILLDALESGSELEPTDDVADVFKETPPKKTIHIIVQLSARPSDDLHPEVAVLRKQLSEMLDSSISLAVVVKPEKKASFTWSTFVDKATLDDFKASIFECYPQYAHDEYLEIFVYNGHPKPERIRGDEDLQKLLKIAKTSSKNRLIISLETPTKNFSKWTFPDVCQEYNLFPDTPDPALEDMVPFTDIQAVPLESEDEKKVLGRLIDEVGLRVDVLKLLGANEATKSMVVSSFLLAATKLFEADLYLAAQRDLSGRRGNGPVDFSVHSRKNGSYTLGVTEVKKEDFKQGVAQNIVQLESALTAKKRKRDLDDIEGEEEPLKTRSYGIVTDGSTWLFLECTLHEDESVTYRMSELEKGIKFAGADWKKEAEFIFARLVWLWSQMVEEIPARDSYARKSVSSPSNKRTAS